MLDSQQDLYLCPAAWNTPPVIYTHTHTQGLSCPEKRGEKTRTLGRKGCLEMLARRRSQKAADAWNSVRATPDGGCPQPRGPRGYHRSGCHGNGAM